MKTFKKTFTFLDKKNHRAIITVVITTRKKYFEFTAMGQFLEKRGQCLDSIKPATTTQSEFLELCKKYHLKDISKIKDFDKKLISIIEFIEEEEKNRIKKKKEKTGDDKILELMEEWGIEEDQLAACKAFLSVMGLDELSFFGESYSGEFCNDAEFTQQLLADVGDVPMNLPSYVCIDWECTAVDIMHDYIERDGFYFRFLTI